MEKDNINPDWREVNLSNKSLDLLKEVKNIFEEEGIKNISEPEEIELSKKFYKEIFKVRKSNEEKNPWNNNSFGNRIEIMNEIIENLEDKEEFRGINNNKEEKEKDDLIKRREIEIEEKNESISILENALSEREKQINELNLEKEKLINDYKVLEEPWIDSAVKIEILKQEKEELIKILSDSEKKTKELNAKKESHLKELEKKLENSEREKANLLSEKNKREKNKFHLLLKKVPISNEYKEEIMKSDEKFQIIILSCGISLGLVIFFMGFIINKIIKNFSNNKESIK